jgi:uncharacterized protein YifN (PemK superfamily)
MKNTVLFICSLVIVSNCFSQGFIDLKKAWVKEQLTQYVNSYKLKTITEETDSTITFKIRDTSVKPLDVIIHFDHNDKCDEETHISDCDTCIQKYIADILNDKDARWVKISNMEYVSKYSLKLILELDPANPLVYYIKRNDYTRKQYKRLIKH